MAEPPARMRRTLSAPLLGRRAFDNIPSAGAIAGPDTYGGFRREFVRRQREQEQAEKVRLLEDSESQRLVLESELRVAKDRGGRERVGFPRVCQSALVF